MSQQTLPTTVTRFYGNADFAKDVLRGRRIALVHVSLLNDPFDPYTFFETDFGDSFPQLLAYVKANHPEDLGWFRAQVPAVNWLRATRELTDYMEKVRKHVFVFSTSSAFERIEPKHNLYMWGHYANGHRGIAIEFDVEKLSASLIEEHKRNNGNPLGDNEIWCSIEYAKSFRPISAADVFEFMKQEHDLDAGRIKQRRGTALEEYYRRTTIIKSEVWQRENEWRLMWHDDESKPPIRLCPITNDCIKNIYVGLSFAGDVQEVVGLAKGNFPTATVLRAVKQHGDFAVQFPAF